MQGRKRQRTGAALVAALRPWPRTGERVAVSTYTRALQRQILSDIDRALRATQDNE